MKCVTSEIFLELLNKMKEDYLREKKFSDNSLSMLSFLFEDTALQAFELIDQQCITLIRTPSGRELYQIQKNSRDFYICLKNSNYCSCPAFFFQVLRKGHYMCKHKLATILCSIIEQYKELQYSDETISLMLAGEN